MPIKYNLTKYDMLAERIHELSQKKDETFSKDEETLRAEATLIASFASAHSWQTFKTITEGKANEINSAEIKNEHNLAKTVKWKKIRNMDIQEVARTNINGMFSTWLYAISVDKATRETYKNAWNKLVSNEFNEECDGISVQKQS